MMRSCSLGILAVVLPFFSSGGASSGGALSGGVVPATQPVREGSRPGPDSFKAIPRARWLAESARAFAIRDKNPKAPVHILIVSKEAIPTMLEAPDELLGDMLGLAKRIAEQEGIARDGFRVVINTNPKGGQSVYHVHMHVLGGRQMEWPPG